MSAFTTAEPAGLQVMELIRDGDLPPPPAALVLGGTLAHAQAVMSDGAGREVMRATATCHVRGQNAQGTAA